MSSYIVKAQSLSIVYLFTIRPAHGILATVLIALASVKGSDEPVQTHSYARAFAFLIRKG